MEINQDLLGKISSLNDDELANAVKTVGQMLGVNPNTAKKFSSNTKAIRKKLNEISEKDIEKIKKSVGENEIANIISALGLSDKGGE